MLASRVAAATRGVAVGVGAASRGVQGATVRATPVRAYSGRGPTGVAETVYQVAWKKQPSYITYIVIGAIVLETFFGKVTDSLWDSVNYGVRAFDSDMPP